MKNVGWNLVIFVILFILFENLQASSLSLYEPETTIKPVIEETLIKKNTTSTLEGSSSSAGATCSCDNTDSPVCASNGVSYKNSCRFNCIKKRVKRLRVVKNGPCNGLTLDQYRASQNRRS